MADALSHATPTRDLSPQEAKELADRAHVVEAKIVKACQSIRTTGIYLAKYLSEFFAERYWMVLGYESQAAFLASPDIDLKERQALKLAAIYREVVVDRGVPEAELVGVDLEKIQKALPALKEGRAGVLDVVSDAKALSRSDMAVKYGDGDPNARLDATQEPERKSCPTCGSYVEVERIK